jgi:class I fructose-bisphosphate aldolase
VIHLANEGKFSAIVLHKGIAQKYQHELRPDLPLIFKVDGHISSGKEADSPTHATFASIQEGLRLGAKAIGVTFYLGSTKTSEDMERIGKLIEKSHRYGLPVVLWSYPRGPHVNKTQADSLYWCHYAVAAAESLGADIVKTKFPAPVKPDYKTAYEEMLKKHKIKDAPKYLELEPKEGERLSYDQQVYRMKLVVDAAPKTYVIVSGGPKIKGDARKTLIESTKIVMDAGAEGRIIGRNFWGVPIEQGLELSNAVANVMMEPQYHRKLSRQGFDTLYS